MALVLAMVLTGCAPSRSPGGKKPVPAGQPTIMPAASTNELTPSHEGPGSTLSQGVQAPSPAVSPTLFAVPEQLPTKGSPEAKVTLVEFFDFQ
jgi:hypothetical protein